MGKAIRIDAKYYGQYPVARYLGIRNWNEFSFKDWIAYNFDGRVWYVPIFLDGLKSYRRNITSSRVQVSSICLKIRFEKKSDSIKCSKLWTNYYMPF